MNDIKGVKVDENAKSYQSVDEISKNDYKSTSEVVNDSDDSGVSADNQNDDLNYVTISSDGIEGSYHKAGLIIGVLVIFFLGVLVGALVF